MDSWSAGAAFVILVGLMIGITALGMMGAL